jgi:hypothetical protein
VLTASISAPGAGRPNPKRKNDINERKSLFFRRGLLLALECYFIIDLILFGLQVLPDHEFALSDPGDHFLDVPGEYGVVIAARIQHFVSKLYGDDPVVMASQLLLNLDTGQFEDLDLEIIAAAEQVIVQVLDFQDPSAQPLHLFCRRWLFVSLDSIQIVNRKAVIDRACVQHPVNQDEGGETLREFGAVDYLLPDYV